MDNTPYDDVFRTLLTDCTELMIPVVNEIFHTKYTGEETVCLLQNEHFIKMPDGREQERITDSSFEIISKETETGFYTREKQKEKESAAQAVSRSAVQHRRYHIECQSTEDGSMIIRMFEYDTQLALENKELTADTLTVRFPDSAVVSLRHTQNTPEEMTVKVQTPGGKVSYKVPVLKIKRYTVNELFEKKLFFLIPFHIFVYEKNFKELEENKKKLKQLEEEYAAIRERLEIACQMGDLTDKKLDLDIVENMRYFNDLISGKIDRYLENCKSRFTKKYDDDKLKAIWLHLKEENYINSNTSLDTFLYLFGNVDNVPERFYIEWLASLKELHVLIDVFWKSERNRWKKASEIFLYGDEFLKYRSLTTAVSKEDDIEDIEKKFACWLKEK